MNITKSPKIKLEAQIKRIVLLFMIGLVLSGLTAFPIQWQLNMAHQWIQYWHVDNMFTHWLDLVYEGVRETNERYPFISYGTDWLAFAHLVIALAFVGPLRNSVRNIWVIEFGIIACIAVFPLAFIAGAVRGIPIYWRLIDCSFGVIGGMLLLTCYGKIKQVEKLIKMP